jgi:hypothetical protein
MGGMGLGGFGGVYEGTSAPMAGMGDMGAPPGVSMMSHGSTTGEIRGLY